jgi:hypothetical protein
MISPSKRTSTVRNLVPWRAKLSNEGGLAPRARCMNFCSFLVESTVLNAVYIQCTSTKFSRGMTCAVDSSCMPASMHGCCWLLLPLLRALRPACMDRHACCMNRHACFKNHSSMVDSSCSCVSHCRKLHHARCMLQKSLEY